ncbi:PilZ domain-containing protein [Lacrimispora sp. JR3]|uniref:PilZ domain-containing protein n=1 Tax=Lacrimispora sinapis TaxID=3111456 RepID=UPI00374A4F16
MFAECKKATIYSFAGSLLAEVEVVDCEKDIMGLIVQKDDIGKIGSETMVVFYDGVKGLVTCKCRLSGWVKQEDGLTYRVSCRVDKQISEEERRRAMKVRVQHSVTLEILTEEGKVIHIQAVVKDLSAGGAGFECKEELKEEQSFSFLFETKFGCVRLKGCILWKKEFSDKAGNPYYRYGSRFLDMTAHQESMLRKIISFEYLKNTNIQ